MKINRLNIALVLGFVAILGILIVQLLWTKAAFNAEGKKFSQKVHISLLRTLERLYQYENKEFPLKNPIHKISNDYYVVNVNNDFGADLLEYCLKTEFTRAGLFTDFEYAIYKCESDEMVYGNYVSINDKSERSRSIHFPKQKNLVYYFAIRFPNESNYLLGSMRFWILLSVILLVILLIYIYSVFTILQQKKYSGLQSDFINNMTHEFKTPLSSILIASTYLSKQAVIFNDERLSQYTGIIRDQSLKLDNHIMKLLNIAKLDSATPEINKEAIHLVPVLNNIIENIKLLHRHLEVELICELNDPVIEADEFHFRNIVLNLLDNSAKYCDGSAKVKLNLLEVREGIRMEFKDDGIGVPVPELSFIFDKFYRSRSNKSSEASGFGLGLYYVKKICHAHLWKIAAFNNTPKGITISLTIPKHR